MIARTFGLVLLFTLGLAADPPPLTITDAGYFYTILDEAGYPSYQHVENITDLRGNKPEEPEEPEDKPPPVGISNDVYGWASEVDDPKGAQEYAMLMATVRDGVLADKVTNANLFDVLRESGDAVLNSDWDVFRQNLSEYFSAQMQEGDLSSKVQIANKLELIRYGSKYSARNSPSITEGEALAVISKTNSVINANQ